MSGRYLLEWMPLHRERRAANVGGRSGVVQVQWCVFLWLSRYLVVGLRKRCAGVRARSWRLDTVCWFMLLCVAFSIYYYTGCAHTCKIRRSCVLNTALDVAAASLCVEPRVRGSKVGEKYCEVCDTKRRFFEYGLCLGRRRSVMLGVG